MKVGEFRRKVGEFSDLLTKVPDEIPSSIGVNVGVLGVGAYAVVVKVEQQLYNKRLGLACKVVENAPYMNLIH